MGWRKTWEKMKMRKEANDFLKICDILDRDYQKADGNKFRYTKTYLEQNVGSDYDQLKSLHAEATDGKASDTYAMLTNLFAVIISTVTLVITIGNALAPAQDGKVDKAFIFLCVLYTIVVLIVAFLFDWSIGKNKSLEHWQQYIVEAIEDILDNMENEKENHMETKLPDKLYDKLDALETKVNLPDKLYEQLDTIRDAASESPFKKVFQKK